jgi:hypothetical protein
MAMFVVDLGKLIALLELGSQWMAILVEPMPESRLAARILGSQ